MNVYYVFVIACKKYLVSGCCIKEIIVRFLIMTIKDVSNIEEKFIKNLIRQASQDNNVSDV